MSLEKTTWNLNDGSGVPSTVYFGINGSTDKTTAGGYGTITTHYGGSTGDIEVDMIWIEDQKGNFMYQTKGPTEDSLPTVSGMYHGTSALGWGTNFDAAWGFWRVQLTQAS